MLRIRKNNLHSGHDSKTRGEASLSFGRSILMVAFMDDVVADTASKKPDIGKN